eukprot:SAG11_NODE_87_length_17256_cov_15.295156_15_plen_204_part_00
MKYTKRNSFIANFNDKEKKDIRKLYEATTASASGSYSQPLGWKEETISPCEASALEVEGEDNVVDGSEELTIDIDELMGMIGLSEEDEKERMRSLHKESAVIKEQSLPTTKQLQEIAECLQTSLGDVVEVDTELVFPLSCFNCYMFPTVGMFPPQINPECKECLEESSAIGKVIYDATTNLDIETLNKIKGCVPTNLIGGSGI